MIRNTMASCHEFQSRGLQPAGRMSVARMYPRAEARGSETRLCHALLLLVLSIATGCTSANNSSHTDDEAPPQSTRRGAMNTDKYLPLPLPPASDVRTIAGAPGPAYWQQRCDHDIRVVLDVEDDSIHASQTMIYTNNSPDELSVLWIQLEQNHFRSDSDGTVLGGPSDRFGNRTRFEGGIENLEATLVAADSKDPISPSRHQEMAAWPWGVTPPVPPTRVDTPLKIEVHGTVARIDLPQPVLPRGGRMVIEMKWSFAIPEYGDDRMGIKHAADGDIYQIAQWFPTMCVYDDVTGWNTRQFLGLGEFYTHFGRYSVAITVPSDHLVVATGQLQNEGDVLTSEELSRLSQARAGREPVVIVGRDEAGKHASPRTENGMTTWQFGAEDVRTFVWASSRAFMWDACTIRADSATRGEVLVQSFYPKEAAGTWAPDAKDVKAARGDAAKTESGSTRMLRDSIIDYGARWYPYPYPTASNVHGLAGGMEYPMVIFCDGGESAGSLWGVTTHEIGHTWFPMVVNSNERVHAWMDEGLNSFMNHYATLERYGSDDGSHKHHHGGDVAPRRLRQIVDTPPDILEPGTLGLSQYARPAIALQFLRERVLGHERFDRAFRAYIERWAFKSPTPADFFRTMESESGVELDWFFRAWFYSTDSPDIGVKSVNQPEGSAKTTRVSFQNIGGMVMPVQYRVTYTDGTTEDRHVPVEAWAAGDTAADWWDTQGRSIERVEIDPEGLTPDYNPRNNVWGK